MQKYLNLNFKKKNAFTLLEMVISVGIFVLVATASSVLFNQAINAYRFTVSRMAAAREAELAMQKIVQDIRPDEFGTAKPILNAGVESSGLNDISLDLPAGNNVHYHLHATAVPGISTIQREEVNAGISVREDLLAENVVSLSFGYFDPVNQAVLPTGNVRTVQIIIVTQVNEQTFRLYSVANR